jgi:MoaA/NifB/PqqE/SkfB family radical SAM enzyme
MKIGLLQLLSHLENHLLQKVILPSGFSLAKPLQFVMIPTLKCCCRCVMCDCWKIRIQDLEIDKAQQAISDFRRWFGPGFMVHLTGGEPLLYPAITDLVRHCSAIGAMSRITTCGLPLNEQKVRELADAGLSFITVSVDSLRAETHDALRGVPNCLEKAICALRRSVEAGLKTGVIVLISERNIRDLVEMVRRIVDDLNVSLVAFQPIIPSLLAWTGEWSHRENLMVSDFKELERAIEGLVQLKRGSYRFNILNSVKSLESIGRYFKTPRERSLLRTAPSALNNVFIAPDGRVRLLWETPPIGSILYDRLGPEMWNSKPARTIRKVLISESRHELICQQPLTLSEKAGVFLALHKSYGARFSSGLKYGSKRPA